MTKPYTDHGETIRRHWPEVYARPSDIMPDDMIREHLANVEYEAEGLEEKGRLLPHHIDALIPHVRVCLDAMLATHDTGTQQWPELNLETWPQSLRIAPVREMYVTQVLYRTLYWSARGLAIRQFPLDLLEQVYDQAVVPLAEHAQALRDTTAAKA